MTSSATSSDRPRRPPVQPALLIGLIGGGLLLIGWVVILYANHWHLTAPVIFLMLGWLSVLATAWFLGRTAWAATAPESSLDDLDRAGGQYEDLQAEKKTLLRALKEIEFDHQMGKMSDEDAAQLQRYYRSRAIEVLKAIDALEQGGGGSALERIEREVRARLALEGKTTKAAAAKAEAAAAKAEPAAAAKPEPAAETRPEPPEDEP